MDSNFLQHDLRGSIYCILKCTEFPIRKGNAGSPSLPQFPCVLGSCWQLFTTRKLIQQICTKHVVWKLLSKPRYDWAMTFSYFFIAVSKNYFNPNWKKVKILFTNLRLPMLNRASIQLFLLLNWRLKVWSFGRCGIYYFWKKKSKIWNCHLLQIIAGPLWVKSLTIPDMSCFTWLFQTKPVFHDYSKYGLFAMTIPNAWLSQTWPLFHDYSRQSIFSMTIFPDNSLFSMTISDMACFPLLFQTCPVSHDYFRHDPFPWLFQTWLFQIWPVFHDYSNSMTIPDMACFPWLFLTKPVFHDYIPDKSLFSMASLDKACSQWPFQTKPVFHDYSRHDPFSMTIPDKACFPWLFQEKPVFHDFFRQSLFSMTFPGLCKPWLTKSPVIYTQYDKELFTLYIRKAVPYLWCWRWWFLAYFKFHRFWRWFLLLLLLLSIKSTTFQ